MRSSVVVLTLLCITGCGSAKSGFVPVEGTVDLDGKPLAGVQVLFDQPDATNGKAFVGETDESGRYKLRPLGEEKSGVAPGEYRVTLTTAVTPPGAREGDPPPPERVPPKYGNGKLSFTVPYGGSTDASFKLSTR
jgi:hypothetical protein